MKEERKEKKRGKVTVSRNISFFIMRKHRLAPLTGVNSSYESITAVSGGNDNFTKKQTVKKKKVFCLAQVSEVARGKNCSALLWEVIS